MMIRKTEYAIRALWELAQADEYLVVSRKIAHLQSIPARYLPQIMSELVRSGLLNSSRGYGCQASSVDCKELPLCDLRQVYEKARKSPGKVLASEKLSDLKPGKGPVHDIHR